MANWLKHISHKLLRTGTLKRLLLGSCVGLITGVISFLLYLGIDIVSGVLLKGVAGYTPAHPPVNTTFSWYPLPQSSTPGCLC